MKPMRESKDYMLPSYAVHILYNITVPTVPYPQH